MFNDLVWRGSLKKKTRERNEPTTEFETLVTSFRNFREEYRNLILRCMYELELRISIIFFLQNIDRATIMFRSGGKIEYFVKQIEIIICDYLNGPFKSNSRLKKTIFLYNISKSEC